MTKRGSMKVYEQIIDIKKELLQHKDQTIGFVPTMGNLHEGHLSLVRQSKKECDITVVSIYVNPTQFGPNEDLSKYPKTMKADLNALENLKTDFIFTPTNEIMYQKGYSTYVNEEELTKYLCGAKRPGHFRGVTTIVLKLFNIIKPTKSYFGQKDYQQLFIIKKMIKDLNMEIEVVACPIVRESDGLAMSSRNNYLSKKEREIAPNFYKTLKQILKTLKNGENNSQKLVQAGKKHLSKSKEFKLDYLEIRDADNLEEVDSINKPCVCAIATFLGKTRLIDNIILTP